MKPGTLFKRLRLARGLDLRAVAASALLSRSSISNFEHDRLHPRIHDLISLCKAIDIKALAFLRIAYLDDSEDSDEKKLSVLLASTFQKTAS